MTVAIAASAAFVTPVSTTVVTLVVAPGNYRFLDFVKVGAPLLLLTWATTLRCSFRSRPGPSRGAVR